MDIITALGKLAGFLIGCILFFAIFFGLMSFSIWIDTLVYPYVYNMCFAPEVLTVRQAVGVSLLSSTALLSLTAMASSSLDKAKDKDEDKFLTLKNWVLVLVTKGLICATCWVYFHFVLS